MSSREPAQQPSALPPGTLTQNKMTVSHVQYDGRINSAGAMEEDGAREVLLLPGGGPGKFQRETSVAASWVYGKLFVFGADGGVVLSPGGWGGRWVQTPHPS